MNIVFARARAVRVGSNNAAAVFEFRGVVFPDAAEPPQGLGRGRSLARSLARARSFALDRTWRRLLLKVWEPSRSGLANLDAL